MNNHEIRYLEAIIATKEVKFAGKCGRGTLGGFLGSARGTGT
jgi:hypothetical protein